MDVDPSSTKFRQNNFFRNSERRPRPVGLRHNNMNRRKLQTEELEPERKEIYWSVNVYVNVRIGALMNFIGHVINVDGQIPLNFDKVTNQHAKYIDVMSLANNYVPANEFTML